MLVARGRFDEIIATAVLCLRAWWWPWFVVLGAGATTSETAKPRGRLAGQNGFRGVPQHAAYRGPRARRAPRRRRRRRGAWAGGAGRALDWRGDGGCRRRAPWNSSTALHFRVLPDARGR